MQIRYEVIHRLFTPRVIALSAILCLQIVGSCERVYAQEAPPPIEEEGFLKALHEKALPIKELTKDVNTRGVAFPLTNAVESEIRREGQYLGKIGIEKLIDAVRSNYRPHQRLRVSLLKYSPCGQYYDQFAELLSSKVNALPSRLILKDGRSGYTAGLKLVKEEKSVVMSLLEANEYWEKTQSLQLLQGICTSKGNDVYMISQVFLGDLHGRLGNTIRIEFKVDPNEFATTRDIHSLLILYSLAKDAQARGLSKDLVIAYLSEALGIATQITHSDPATLQFIRSAIEGMLRELGAADLLALPTQ
jgi:hypothetical protein